MVAMFMDEWQYARSLSLVLFEQNLLVLLNSADCTRHFRVKVVWLKLFSKAAKRLVRSEFRHNQNWLYT
jgi:hypothetical protein